MNKDTKWMIREFGKGLIAGGLGFLAMHWVVLITFLTTGFWIIGEMPFFFVGFHGLYSIIIYWRFIEKL